MTNHTDFFTTEVAQHLQRLRSETERLWGTMSAAQMVDHLLAGTHVFLAKKVVPLTVPEEKLERLRIFLMSDRNFMEGAPKPEQYQEYEAKGPADFEALKAELVAAVATFNRVTQTDPDFWCFHPSFGKLNAEETRQLQYKHIRHHFQQFGLMPRE